MTKQIEGIERIIVDKIRWDWLNKGLNVDAFNSLAKNLAQAIWEAIELDEFVMAQILVKYCGEKCAYASNAISLAKEQIIEIKEKRL